MPEAASVPLNPEQHILPIFVAEQRPDRPPLLAAFCGTAFLLEGGILLTAWHVVSRPLSASQSYMVMFKSYGSGDDRAGVAPIHDLAPDESGWDMASGWVLRPGGPGLVIAREQARLGEEVCTWGFPLMPAPEVRADDGAKVYSDFAPRYLQGYVSRVAATKQVDGTRPPVIELDMPAPPGISGAPLLRVNTGEVLGVILGERSTSQGDNRWAFAVAQWTETMWQLRGPALQGKNLLTRALQAQSGNWFPWDGPTDT